VEIAVTDPLPLWLSARPDGKRLLIRLDGDKWNGTSDEPFDLVLSLTDSETGSVGLLRVTGEWQLPAIEVTPMVLHFGRVAQGQNASMKLAIRNKQRGELIVKEIVLDHEWVSASPTTAEGDEGLSVMVNASGLKPGRHRAQLDIVSNDPRNPRLEIRLDIRVTG
jgi:hypothetical protein